MLAFGVGSGNVTSRSQHSAGMSVRIPLARQKMIFRVVLMGGLGCDLFWNGCVIPVHHVNHAVRTQTKTVIAMLTLTSNGLEEEGFIITPLIILIAVDPAVKTGSLRPMTIDVKAVMGIEKPHGMPDLAFLKGVDLWWRIVLKSDSQHWVLI